MIPGTATPAKAHENTAMALAQEANHLGKSIITKRFFFFFFDFLLLKNPVIDRWSMANPNLLRLLLCRFNIIDTRFFASCLRIDIGREGIKSAAVSPPTSGEDLWRSSLFGRAAGERLLPPRMPKPAL